MSDDLVELSEPMTLMRTKDVRHLLDRIEELEAKLAKFEAMTMVDFANYLNVKNMTTLAELTGGKDA